jgi:hypothetical protein
MVLADLAEIDDEMLTAQQCLRDDVRRSLQFLLREQEEGKISRRPGGDREGRAGWGVCVNKGAALYSEGGGAEQRTGRGNDREKENKGRENVGEKDNITDDDREIDKAREEAKIISSELEKDLGTQLLGHSAHTDSPEHDPVLLARYPML